MEVGETCFPEISSMQSFDLSEKEILVVVQIGEREPSTRPFKLSEDVLRPAVRLTMVFPKSRWVKIAGAFRVYQSFLVMGSTLFSIK